MYEFKTFEEYLCKLDRAQTDEQRNRMHKHFSTLLERVKIHGTQLKMHFQSFRSIAHNISEIFCVILHMKQAIVHLKKILISLDLVQYKFDNIRFKFFPHKQSCIGKLLYELQKKKKYNN